MATKAEVKLFSFPYSPYALSVQIALKEKEIPFELENVDLGNKTQELLDANPIHKQVPTLIHNGKPVVESLIILEYLEEAFPQSIPLMPKGAFEKSQVRFWADYVNKSLSKVSASLRAKPGSPEKEAANAAIATFPETLNAAITGFSAEGPFFFGDKFGLVDAVLAPVCSTLSIIMAQPGAPMRRPEDLSRLYKWIEGVKEWPSVKSTLPSTEEYMGYVQMRIKQYAEAHKSADAQ